jgi:outer membrane protein assembly factor BamA
MICIFVLTFTSSCNIKKHLAENEYLVEKTTVAKNGTSLEKSEIEAFIRQKPNRKILKLFRFNLWLYNQVNQQKMLAYKEKRNLRYDKINEKRLAKIAAKNEKRIAKGKTAKLPKLKNKEKPTFRESILEAGEAPVILDPSLTKITVNQIQQYVFSNGYFDSKVQDSVVLDKKHKRAKIYYSISKSIPYTIQYLSYNIEDPLLERFIYNDTTASFIKRGAVYNESILQKERDRITNNQLNNGFFFFASEYIKYLVDTNLTGNNVHLTLVINKYSEPYSASNDSLIYRNHPRFYLQNIYVIPETIPEFRGKASDIYMKDTTLYNDITFLHNNKLLFKRKDISRCISVAPGQLYQQDLAEDTYKELTGLKVFKTVFLQYVKNPYYSDKLDCYIVCQPVVKQAITMEVEGTNTSGNLGVAGNIVFQNKNAFKGAELVELKLKGSLTAQKALNSSETSADLTNLQKIFNTFQFGPELSIYFPKPLFPFTLFYYKKNEKEKRFFSQPKTILNASLNYQSSQLFTRTIANMSYGFRFTNSKGLLTYDIVPIEAYTVKAQLTDAYQATLYSSKDYFLLNAFQDHLTTLSKLSATYNNQNVPKKNTLTYLKVTLSSSGSILRGFYNVTEQPKDSLGRYKLFSTPFSQFVKAEIDYRLYFKIRKLDKLVYRFAGGIGKPLANLSVLPYEQSFFSGGPNGIRAWRARTLGPGSYDPSNSTARYDKIGDVQLESNLEYRFHIFKSFYGAWFVDAGNVWTLNKDPNKPNGNLDASRFYKEIAIGSGFGLRYDFSFFVLRLDAAVRIRDPQYAENNRWTFDKQPIRNTTILNFGIGYPF